MSWEDEAVVEDIAAAGRLLSDAISRDLRSFDCGDLLDSLESARYASHPYTTPPKEWPPYVDVASVRELPPQLVERYNAAGGQGTALCGVFPTIRRAWATVDETLFIWRFDKWDGTCAEYSGEEQAICAVGLARVRPKVFVEAIQYLLVLATPVELVLLGVCCGASSDGSDPYAELSLQPLPEYTLATDGITMTCVAATEKGRIFLGGRDGHVYEMLYTSGLGWQSRCRMVCHTGGLGSLISRWVIPNALKFGAADSVVEIAVDDERNVMYSRTQESKVQVYDLGKSGDAPPRKIGEEKNLGDNASRHGLRAVSSRAASRASKTSIVSVSPLSSVESKWLHVVVISSDGRRIFMSTTPLASGQITGGMAAIDRPSVLRVVTTRPAPSINLGGGLTGGAGAPLGGRPQAEGLAVKVEAAQYSSGTYVVSDSSPPSTSRLLVARKDYTTSLLSGQYGTTGRSSRTLRELVSILGVEGRTLATADVLPPSEQAAIAHALVWDSSSLDDVGEATRARALWALGDLATQHILPRKRTVVLSTIGLMEIVMNRPVDILHRLLETSISRTVLEDFFQRFGPGEAAAMCLLLASRIVALDDRVISTAVAERAAEAFEDPRLVGLPKMQGAGPTTTTANAGGAGFNMGQVVQEAEPVFSGAHEGLCICAARLLWSIWELPVFVVKGDTSDVGIEGGGILTCRVPVEAMQALEEKIRSLESFLRARRNQRRGHYGRIMGIGDLSGYGDKRFGTDGYVRSELGQKGLFDTPFAATGGGATKRQRLSFSPAELAAMEVRGMECIRRLLRRSSEAFLLLQLLTQHHLTRLVQSIDPNTRRQLVQLTFHQLVCSQEGDFIATRLIAALMEYYVSPEGRGTVDDISLKLRDGCPSYYKEADFKFYQSVECLERAACTFDVEERERLAREALDLLAKVPESADLLSVCQRFEEIRYYEAVVELPLRKAKALDPNEDAFNEHIDESQRKMALAARQQCYEVVTNALRSLVTQFSQNGHVTVVKSLDAEARKGYIRQIIQLGVRSSDHGFHEYLYQTMIELGLDEELLELSGPDLVPFLQAAGQLQLAKPAKASRAWVPFASPLFKPSSAQQVRYLELLAKYYTHKRQHALAAYVLLRLAERKQTEGEQLTLHQRYTYLSSAVLQARSISHGAASLASSTDISEGGLVELLEGKLCVLKFQLSIQEELDRLGGDMDIDGGDVEPSARAAKEKSLELGTELKSITQLYNSYAVPFELWEICLEILHFSNYSGDAENNVMRETWARLLDQAIRNGGIAEACSVLKRVGPRLYPSSVPLDSICLHLERAAEERATTNTEIVGDDDVARALLTACLGSPEPVQRTYEQLLTSSTVAATASLRLRLLRSVLAVVNEWASLAISQESGERNRLCSIINRYMTEVRRLPLPPPAVEPVAAGFKELEEMLLGSQSLQLR